MYLKKIWFSVTFLLLISFASVNAVLFTPALPQLTDFFHISENSAQFTITVFLIGYALGQLFYGPLANRWGRKKALYAGIFLQIASSLLCAATQKLQLFSLLIVGRFLLALGSGVGLKMTFTLINEYFEPKVASQKISYLLLAFAITPGLAVTLGGFLTEHFGWVSCFYAEAIYGVLLFFLTLPLVETYHSPDIHALELSHLSEAYALQFKNIKLIGGGLLMGSATAAVYLFAAVSPFVAMNIFGVSSKEYGLLNLLPPIGLFVGSLTSAYLSKEYSTEKLIQLGIIFATLGVAVMFVLSYLKTGVVVSLFCPMILVYFGFCFIIANGSALAMSYTEDKSHGSAVMNFINIGFGTLIVLLTSLLPIRSMLLPSAYLALCFFMMGVLYWVIKNKSN